MTEQKNHGHSSRPYAKNAAGRRWGLLLAMMLLALLAGCTQPETTPVLQEGQYYTYYVNSSGTALVSRIYEAQATDLEELVEELFLQCQMAPEGGEGRRAIPSSVVVTQSPVLEDRIANLYFDTTYTTMDKLTELLCKAAMAKTITQLPQVDYIRIYVNDEVYKGQRFETNSNEATLPGVSNDEEWEDLDDGQDPGAGQTTGSALTTNLSGISTEKTLWSGSDFLDNTGDDTNKYIQTELTLYFAHPDGKALLTEVRQVVYSSTLSLERVVLNQLIEGPEDPAMISTLPKNLKITGVSLRDGICYVDFDATFLEEPVNVTDQVEIYSIVNSLTQLNNVLQVQFTINGSANAVLRNNIPLSGRFEKDLSLMYTPEEEEEPTTEMPTTEVPTTEAPTTEEPTTEEPTIEETTVEETAVETSVNEAAEETADTNES